MAKVLFKSVITTPGFLLMDVYLNTYMDQYEYMHLLITIIPTEFIQQYNLLPFVHNAYIYMEVQQDIQGSGSQAFLLTNYLPKTLPSMATTKQFTPQAYGPTKLTQYSSSSSSMVIGIKYVGKQHRNHLFNTLAEHYNATPGWDGTLCYAITLNWDYTACTVDLSMPSLVKAALHKFQHP